MSAATWVVWLLACSGQVIPPDPDEDRDGFSLAEDCDDRDRTRFPGADERCDGRDDDCDGAIDEGFDLDGDGALTGLDPGCAALGPTDCDDADPLVRPGAIERCDGRDEDCDGVVDLDVDADEDGAPACDDCDDADAGARPGGIERCNGADDDCDGESDEGYDEDGDGVGACLDCDDADPTVHPGAVEACNGKDEDCDTLWDEGFDEDDDGFSTCRGDCDDADPTVNPWAEEACDGVDTDCDPTTDEAVDADGDGFTVCTADCDEDRAESFLGATEGCNGWDDDCDGDVDEDGVCAPCEVKPWRGRAYLFCDEALTWSDAIAACEARGYELVAPGTPEEDEWLAEELLSGDRWWIALHDADHDGTWTWADEEVVALWTAWAPGQPATGDCATLVRDEGWASAGCATRLPYTCEVPW